MAPWTAALDRAADALSATPTPALPAATEALSQAHAAADAAAPMLGAAEASFAALRRATNQRRVFPPVALAAASAFRGAAGAYHDRAARMARLQRALARAQAPPAPAPGGLTPGGG